MNAPTQVRSEDPTQYTVAKTHEEHIIQQALAILHKRVEREHYITEPATIHRLLTIRCCEYEHEVFGIVLLDTRHGVLGIEDLFRGTINGASVYPREVVKHVLRYNAASVILFHNHPSGNPEPSNADIKITHRLHDALALIEVPVLDHIVVAGGASCSLAQRGEIVCSM